MAWWLTRVIVGPTATVSALGVKVKLLITTCGPLITACAAAVAGGEARAVGGADVAALAWAAGLPGAAAGVGPHAPSSSAASNAIDMAGRGGREQNAILNSCTHD